MLIIPLGVGVCCELQLLLHHIRVSAAIVGIFKIDCMHLSSGAKKAHRRAPLAGRGEKKGDRQEAKAEMKFPKPLGWSGGNLKDLAIRKDFRLSPNAPAKCLRCTRHSHRTP